MDHKLVIGCQFCVNFCRQAEALENSEEVVDFDEDLIDLDALLDDDDAFMTI